MHILLALLLPLLCSVLVFTIRQDPLRRTVTAISLFVCAAAAVSCVLLQQDAQLCLYQISDHLRIAFRVDELAAFFVILLSLIWCFVQFHAFVYMAHEGKEAQFFGFYLLSYAALLALALADNAVTLVLCFEMMTLCSMPLVLHDGSSVSRKAAIKYLSYSSVGAALALMGFFLLSPYVPSLSFVPGGHDALLPLQPVSLTAAFLIALGFAGKAGLVPMQLWLTEAHPVAPSPASAVLSGLITKGGILALIRCLFFLFPPAALRGTWVNKVLLILAIITVFTGSMLAWQEKLLKKRFAYSSVSQLSYVLFGLFTFHASGFTGALLQMVFHALAKSVLFLSAGSILYRCGCARVDQFSGLGRRMPVTFWCFTLAALSLIGVPPMGGFISKWYLAAGGLHSGLYGLFGVVVLFVSALLTAFYLLPLIASAFFPGKHTVLDPTIKEAPVPMLLPLLFFAALIVLLGMLPSDMVQTFEALGNILIQGG